MINDKMVNEKIDATITALNELVAAIYLARPAQGETPKKEVPKIQVATQPIDWVKVARELSDDELRAIGETGGMVGLNFGTMFLREDGKAVPFKTIMDLTLAASRAGHKALVREKLNEFGAAKIQDLSQENALRYNTWITDLLK
jgi:hypothetical protein